MEYILSCIQRLSLNKYGSNGIIPLRVIVLKPKFSQLFSLFIATMPFNLDLVTKTCIGILLFLTG